MTFLKVKLNFYTYDLKDSMLVLRSKKLKSNYFKVVYHETTTQITVLLLISYKLQNTFLRQRLYLQ